MTTVSVDGGWGLMCPGCYKVITADETGLRGLIAEASDLAFLRGWGVVEFLDSAEMPARGYACPMCVERFA